MFEYIYPFLRLENKISWRSPESKVNLDQPRPKILNFCFCFLSFLVRCFFRFLSCWLEMWFFGNAILSPMSMPHISLLKPTSLICFQGTKWIQDKRDQGQNGTRTRWIQDKMDPIWIQDNREP